MSGTHYYTMPYCQLTNTVNIQVTVTKRDFSSRLIEFTVWV